MRITDVELYPVKTTRRSGSVSRHVVLKLFTDEGLVGLGEISDLGIYRYTMPDLDNLRFAIRRLVVDEDPFQIVKLHLKMMKLLPYWGHSMPIYPPYTIDSQVVAGVEMGLYDLCGKSLQTPVYNLLGGKVRDSFDMTYPIFSCKRPEDVSVRLDEVGQLVAEGWTRFRYYVGEDLAADEQFLQDLRDRFGATISLKGLDFQRKFYWKDTLYWIDRFRPVDFQLVESVSLGEDYEGMAEVRRRCGLPVSEHITSFSHALRLVQTGAVDVFNVSLQIGGIQTALKFFAIAQAAGLKCLLSTTQEMSIGTAATCHLGAVVPELHYPGDVVGPVLYREDVCRERVRYAGNVMYLPDGPGLGVTVDDNQLQALASPLQEWDQVGSHLGVAPQ